MHTSPVGDGKNFLLANPLHVSKKKSPGNWLVGWPIIENEYMKISAN
jgi:hypothetical protein